MSGAPDLEALARSFAASRSASERSNLCEAAMPLVRRIATLVLRRLPAHFSIDDLVGDGCVGLLRAMDRFDPSYGVAFETWATRIIRGSMLNGLRRMDVVPERVRRDARNLDAARWRIALEAGAAPDDRSAAASAGLTTQKLRSVQLALRSAAVLSLDAPLHGEAAPEGAVFGDLIAADEPDPSQRVADTNARHVVSCAVRSLSPRDRSIVAAFYSGNITFREIGKRLGISKQRVSQIHNRALRGLRGALTAARYDA